DLAADQTPVADLAVMHEQPAVIGERMAVRPRDLRAGRCAHMAEKEMRADMAREMPQILVGPGWADFAIDARLALLAVPAEAESVAVQAVLRFLRAPALFDQ